jgi:hypothetical protein
VRELRTLFEDGLLTEDFYSSRIAECEAVKEAVVTPPPATPPATPPPAAPKPPGAKP